MHIWGVSVNAFSDKISLRSFLQVEEPFRELIVHMINVEAGRKLPHSLCKPGRFASFVG